MSYRLGGVENPLSGGGNTEHAKEAVGQSVYRVARRSILKLSKVLDPVTLLVKRPAMFDLSAVVRRAADDGFERDRERKRA